MIRRRRLPPLPPSPPKGYTWLHQRLLPIAAVEWWTRQNMAAFDQYGGQDARHWKNDPSYQWAAQRNRNKEAKRMSIKIYNEDCSGCRPAAMDPKTGEVLPDDHPLMQRILRAWGQTSRTQREAWHKVNKVTCQNSRDPRDLKLAWQFISTVQQDA
jgi:hypothetical protein